MRLSCAFFGSFVLALAGACTEDGYVIGARCRDDCKPAGGVGGAGMPPTAGNGGASPAPGGFEVDLTGSGPERLPQQLFGVAPTQLFIADDATVRVWPARVGDDFGVVAESALVLGEPSPFADPGRVLRHAGAATFSSDGDWASLDGALALEAVFRAEPGAVLLSQSATTGSIELSLDAQSQLTLQLGNGATQLVVSSAALVPDAWHHCLVLVDATEGEAQIICNAHAADAVAVPADFAVPRLNARVALGSSGAARVTWAELARFEAKSWGQRGAWLDVARERFARLVGTFAAGAKEPLPFADVRDSGAYLDMTPSDAPTERRLHPVGAHWPRLVCRPTDDDARTCGLLVEAASSRSIAPADFTLDRWQATGVALTATSGIGPTNERTLFALSPSAATGPHTLELSLALGGSPAVLSLFARAGSARLLRAEVEGVASATFDLESLNVVEETNTLVNGAEDWGDGLVRLSFTFAVEPMMGRLRLTLLSDDGTGTFAGDGSVALELGDAELRVRSYNAPLPMLEAIQRDERLVYPAANGNLAGGPYFDFSAEVWLPNAPLLADAAIVNASFADRFDQQINLFVSPQDGALRFWGLQGDTTPWQFGSPTRVTDGKLHQVVASVDQTGAALSVDGARTTAPAERFDTSVLDRVAIGTSVNSSGALTGIVRRVLLATPNE